LSSAGEFSDPFPIGDGPLPFVFVPVPPVRTDQVACKCGHATDIHTLEDIRFFGGSEDGDEQQFGWLWHCTGMLVPPAGRHGVGAMCPCTNIRPPQALPEVEPEKARWELPDLD
jgi:hypothetical protein